MKLTQQLIKLDFLMYLPNTTTLCFLCDKKSEAFGPTYIGISDVAKFNLFVQSNYIKSLENFLKKLPKTLLKAHITLLYSNNNFILIHMILNAAK